MSVTNVQLHWTSQTGQSTKDGKREYTANYLVTVSSASDGPAVVMAASGLPIPGLSWYQAGNDIDVQALCQSAVPRRHGGEDSRTLWMVECKFAREPEDEKKRDEDGNPTNDPFKWRDKVSVGTTNYTNAVEKAILRRDCGEGAGARTAGRVETPANSAGEKFNPPLEKDDSRISVRITKYMKTAPCDQLLKYKDKVNSDEFTINKRSRGFTLRVPQYAAKMMSIQMDAQRENDIDFWEVTYEISITDTLISTDKHGWRVEVPDLGNKVNANAGDDDGHGGTISASTVTASEQNTRQAVDRDGNPTIVRLDGKGNEQKDKNAKDSFILYSIYGEVSFAPLKL